MKTLKSSKKSSSKQTSEANVTNVSNAQGVKVTKDRTVGAHTPASEQCEHKSAKHHSKGKCVSCYNAARNKKSSKPTKAAKSAAKKQAAK